VFTFEEMGVDFLFVDEAHLFRKLDFTTKMSNLKGITPEGSGMAWDLYVKTLYLDSINPGRSLVLARARRSPTPWPSFTRQPLHAAAGVGGARPVASSTPGPAPSASR
jgi:hypothetical protein